MNVKNIPLDKIRENDWNPNRMSEEFAAALERGIRDNSFVQPLVVRPAGEAFEIIDGAHRFRVLAKLGYEEAPCVVVDDSDDEARLRTVAMNRLRGSMDNFDLAKLLEKTGVSDAELYERLALSQNELDEIRSLASGLPELDLATAGAAGHVLLDFYLDQEDAALVREALRKTGAPHRNRALVALAREYVHD